MNIIIVFRGGLIDDAPILVECSTRATEIYLDLVKELGVIVPKELSDKITYDDNSLSEVIELVEGKLEWSGNEIKWFDIEPLTEIK